MTKLVNNHLLVSVLLSLNLILLIYLILIIGHPSWIKLGYMPTGLFNHISRTAFDFSRDCITMDSANGNSEMLNSIDGTVWDMQSDIKDIKTSVENIESNF